MDRDPGAVRWVEESVGGRVRAIVPLTGGITARDFQHFTVLWRDGRACGVVDRPGAGTGPRGFDVGHCRLNLAVL